MQIVQRKFGHWRIAQQLLKGKNGANARSTYQFVLKKMKRKDIPKISQYNYGFKKFVEQMDAIKNEIVEAE
jgi:soluble cytochrome b562